MNSKIIIHNYTNDDLRAVQAVESLIARGLKEESGVCTSVFNENMLVTYVTSGVCTTTFKVSHIKS
jgi:hypothetical protein